MSNAKRLEFLIITLVAGLSGALFFSLLSLFFINVFHTPDPFTAAVPLQGGYMLFSIASGLLFTARWLSRRSLAVKVLLAFFWIVPLYFVTLSPVYSIPYGIYNLVLYFITRSREQQPAPTEAAPSPAGEPDGPGQPAAAPSPQPIYARPRQPAAQPPQPVHGAPDTPSAEDPAPPPAAGPEQPPADGTDQPPADGTDQP